MPEQQRIQSIEHSHHNTEKPGENQASEPTIIAEQHRKSSTAPGSHSAKSVVSAPSVPTPEKPSNPNPSQRPQYPADPMDPSDPNSPNPIEGAREDLFPKDSSNQSKLNE